MEFKWTKCFSWISLWATEGDAEVRQLSIPRRVSHQPSCKGPHPQRGEEQTQAPSVHPNIPPDNKYLPSASSVPGSLGKLQCLKTSVAPALLELNFLVKWLAVNKHHTSNIIAMKINAVMGKSRTYIVYGGTQEGLPKGGMLRLRCEVLVLARQIGRAKFPRKKKQHVRGPWGQKPLNESKEHRTD